jgi:hypothetical protein
MPTNATTVGHQRLHLASRRFPPAVSSSARGGAFDDVSDAEFEIERQRSFKKGEETRDEAAAVERAPEAVAGATEVPADGGSVEAGVDAGEENDEAFGDEIRDDLVAHSEDLGFGGFPKGAANVRFIGQVPWQVFCRQSEGA